MSEEKRKKRSFSIVVIMSIMTFALCITLISCSDDDGKTISDVKNDVKTEETVETKGSTAPAEETATDVHGSTVEKGGDDETKNTSSDQKSITKEATKTPSSVKKTDNTSTAKKSETKETGKPTAASTQSTATKATTAATTESKKVCYITIEGYCSGKEISLQGGDTVYSILCRSGASVSGSGHYVKGINGRFEFDEGPTSGWTYYLNGSKPTVGCGSCSVKSGDNIKWDYVTSY